MTQDEVLELRLREEAEELRQEALAAFPDAVVEVTATGHARTVCVRLTDKVAMFKSRHYGLIFWPYLSEKAKQYAKYTGFDKYNPAYESAAPNKMNVWRDSVARKWVDRHSAAYDYIMEKYEAAKLDFDTTVASIRGFVKPGMLVNGHPSFNERGSIIANMTNGRYIVHWELDNQAVTAKVKVTWDGDLTTLTEKAEYVPTHQLTWEALDLLGAIRLFEKPGYKLRFEVLMPCDMLGKGIVESTFDGKTPDDKVKEVEARKAWIESFTKLFP